jgi:hypothetical protein
MNNQLLNLKEGIYIPSIEACWLYKFNDEVGNYKVDEEYLDKLLNGKLDYSFELVENAMLIDNIEIEEWNGKLYTLDIVNVKYKNKYKNIVNGKVAEEKGSKSLRNWTYTKGFMFEGKLMTNWKRSGGKARVGQNLFIIDKIKDNCLDWARMGLKFTGKVDIASIRAYESLPLSSIIGTIEINPKNILILDDYESVFDWTMSKTWLENGELYTETVPTKEKNSIWDGEGLLSTNRIFDNNEIIKDKGVCLLRNRYMKCAAFSCDIEQYYKDYCEANGFNYDTYEVEDMYGNSIKVKDILLITTPSAIKINKFNKQVLEKEDYLQYGESAWLHYWKTNCSSTFGICKIEKPSHYCEKDKDGNIITYKNRLSYQMLNSIPYEPIEIKQLVAKEIKYIERLKTDLEFFLQEVKQEQDLEIEDNIEEDDDDTVVEKGTNIDVAGAFVKLVKKNPQFQNTQVFKDYRRNFINAHIKELRQGKIKLDGADYCVACGNPIEMLKATVGEFDGTSVLKNNELYCSRFNDGEDVIGFRNPSINVGNVGIQVNRYVEDIEKYMNCTPNIVFLNSIDYPILSTYQGEDFDIDSNLLISEPITVKACRRIDKNITPIPVNAIANTGSNNAELIGENMANIDHVIAQNYIGSVINLSQEINSYMNHLTYNNLAQVKEFDKLYNMSSRLSSISCCEIDKAKKQFEELNVPSELDIVKKEFKKVDHEKIALIDNDIKKLKIELSKKQFEVKEHRKNERKPILRQIKEIKKQLEDHNNEELLTKITDLEADIKNINLARQSEVDEIKNKITEKYIEQQRYDSRRIKPYFFKFIGDNEAKKQRKATFKKHRREIDQPIIKKYCEDNGIELKNLNLKDKELQKLLKVNDTIQKEWEEKNYDKNIDTPMNWLQLELDKIKDSKKIGTVQVIQLVKKNKNKAMEETVDNIVNSIKKLDVDIKAYKLNEDLSAKDKLSKIRSVKATAVKDILKMKLTKADLYWILRKSLNSVKNNGKIDKKSGVESITLEVLFKAFGTGLLNMFE